METNSCLRGCLPGFWLVGLVLPTDNDSRDEPELEGFRRLADWAIVYAEFDVIVWLNWRAFTQQEWRLLVDFVIIGCNYRDGSRSVMVYSSIDASVYLDVVERSLVTTAFNEKVVNWQRAYKKADTWIHEIGTRAPIYTLTSLCVFWTPAAILKLNSILLIILTQLYKMNPTANYQIQPSYELNPVASQPKASSSMSEYLPKIEGSWLCW